MSLLFIRRGAALLLFGALAAMLLCLPVCALPHESSTHAASDSTTAAETTAVPEGEETLREGSPVTEGTVEQDPHDAIGQMSAQSGGWITVGLCILMVISLLLIIVAMIPGKRK